MAQNNKSAADAAANQKRRRMESVLLASISAKRPPKTTAKVPKAGEVTLVEPGPKRGSTLQLIRPPTTLTHRLGSPELLIGFDIETHGWPKEKQKGRIGQFGWYTVKGETLVEFARIVQIGWAIGRVDEPASVCVKTAYVQPDGFQITKDATDFHKITQAFATQEGRPLADALCDFMADVSEAHSRGGRVVAHNLEFDAGVILNELERCRLYELCGTWRRTAQKGFCTMDYMVGRWVRTCSGDMVGPETAKHCLGLKDITDKLLQDSDKLLIEHHDAGADAKLTRLVYIALLNHAKLAAEAPVVGRAPDKQMQGTRRYDSTDIATYSGSGSSERFQEEP